MLNKNNDTDLLLMNPQKSKSVFFLIQLSVHYSLRVKILSHGVYCLFFSHDEDLFEMCNLKQCNFIHCFS